MATFFKVNGTKTIKLYSFEFTYSLVVTTDYFKKCIHQICENIVFFQGRLYLLILENINYIYYLTTNK